jgi:thiol-disulfide isomerase/thioredoxin
MFKITTFTFSLLLCFQLSAQGPKVGDKAPQIEIHQVLTKNISPDFYQNKFLVLDFWATWCMPCIASFPYLDSISKTMKDDKVAFAIISDEPANKVSNFFKARKRFNVDMIKVIDASNPAITDAPSFSGKTFKNFNITSVPQTFIIDPSGIIKWKGHAQQITKELVESFVEGKPINNPGLTVKPTSTNEVLKSDSSEYAGFTIKSNVMSAPIGSSMADYERAVGVYFWGIELDRILESLLSYKRNQVTILKPEETKMPILTFSITRSTKSTRDSVARIALHELSRYYNFTYEFEDKDQEVFEVFLEKPRKFLKAAAPLDPDNKKGSSLISKEYVMSTNYPFHTLTDLLNGGYPTMIFSLNDRNLDIVKGKKFDFNLPVGNFSQTKKILKEQYGIEIRQKKVSMPSLIVQL